MRKCVFLLALLSGLVSELLWAQPPGLMPEVGEIWTSPEADTGYVTDNAGVIPADQEEAIEQLLWEVEEKTGVEIAVVTITSMRSYPGGMNATIEAFARELFDEYGIGNMPKNDGILLLVSLQDRKARIELGGYYGNIRDSDAQRIMDRKILPAFKRGQYSKGIQKGVEALVREFTGRWVVGWKDLALWAGGAVALLLIAISLFRNGKTGWGWITVGLLLVVLVILFKIFFVLMRGVMEQSGRGHSSSWSSGGFGGGFGGGFSGGGGATGSW